LDSNTLSEFNPLVDKEEKEAREAWATAESHPPPPQPPAEDGSQEVEVPPPLPLKHKYTTSVDLYTDGPSSASSFTTVFPAFANIARSLSRQGNWNDVNRSGAEAVPSPTTLASMAKKQATAAMEETPKPPTGPGGDTPSKSIEPLFDFQRFLDQLKTRSAEPVAKYFRRCVQYLLSEDNG
jgi:Rab5 GDP/GTP exchange factor